MSERVCESVSGCTNALGRAPRPSCAGPGSLACSTRPKSKVKRGSTFAHWLATCPGGSQTLGQASGVPHILYCKTAPHPVRRLGTRTPRLCTGCEHQCVCVCVCFCVCVCVCVCLFPSCAGPRSLACHHQCSLEKPPDLDPFFDDLTPAKSAKELNEHLETRVL